MERFRLSNRFSIPPSATPLRLLDIGGSATVDYLNINSAYTFPTILGTVNQTIQTNGTGLGSWVDIGDDLGNHIANQNIELNGNFLTNDGSFDGFFVDNNGRAGAGANNNNLLTNFTMYDNVLPIFRVTSSPNPGSFVQLQNSGVVEFAENKAV